MGSRQCVGKWRPTWGPSPTSDSPAYLSGKLVHSKSGQWPGDFSVFHGAKELPVGKRRESILTEFGQGLESGAWHNQICS